MKKIKYLIFLGVLFLNISIVSALNQEDYNQMSKIMTEDQMKYVSERAIEIIKNGEVESYDSIAVVKTYYSPSKMSSDYILLEEKAVKAEELESYLSTSCNKISEYMGECNTEYKYLEMLIGETAGRKYFYFYNKWKKMPKYKSFDVIAFRWTGDFSTVQYQGEQYNNVNDVHYDESSQNFYVENNGVGLSQNLVDDATSIQNELVVFGYCQQGGTVSGTYQHAQADITLATSQYYMFSMTGMGGVLSFFGPAMDKYDNTPGIQLNYTC